MEMESTWYLSPGQTLQNTRIEDRGHALNITKNAWGKITGHLDRKKIIQETIEKEQEQRRMLKEGSEAMTKNWDNSVQNIHKRKEEERQLSLMKKEEEKMESFFQLRKEQEMIREKYIQGVRKKIYCQQDAPKALTSALLFSEVLYTRDRQREVEEKMREHERQDQAEYAAKVKQGALDEIREKEEVEQKIQEQKAELLEYYLTEIEKNKRKAEAEKEARIKIELAEMAGAEREMKKMKEIEKQEEKTQKEKIEEELVAFRVQQDLSKEQQEQIDVEQDVVIDIYLKAKHRIDCLRKKKEKELLQEQQLRQQAAARKGVSDAKEKQELEAKRLKDSLEEGERLALEAIAQKEAFKKMLIEERNESKRKYDKRVAEAEFKEKELKKWELINRFKKEEVENAYDKVKEKKNWEGILKFRSELSKQMAENEEERRVEKEKWEAFIQAEKDNDNTDELFFAYADEVYNYAKSRGRPTQPIERAIQEYRKRNNLFVPDKPCANYQPEWKCKKEFVNKKPGRVQHDPKTDPNYNRNKNDKNALYK